MNMLKPWWEEYGPIIRIKVEGGYLYQSNFEQSNSICFVPDVDLTRYASHLKDAYKQGYQNGQEDAKHNHTENLEE